MSDETLILDAVVQPGMSEPAPAATPQAPAPSTERREAPGFWNTVRMLGRLLGRVIEEDRGHDFLDRIETIRALAKAARNQGAWFDLYRYLEDIPSYEVIDVTRAFNQFLNLANIAEQDHQVRNLEEDAQTAWANLFDRLSPEGVADALGGLRIESVLTPHPTEILRRTLVLKYDAIAAELKRSQPSERRLERLIAEAWHTDEIRRERPSPQDEAKWGFAVVENSLWEAVPACLRDIDDALARRNLPALPIDVAPVHIASWMGGDRDGNPDVTAAVTREVLMLARWMAADLYLRDVEALQADLSMKECNGALRNRVGDDPEPYRALLKTVRERLSRTRDWAEGLDPAPAEHVYFTDEELVEPLRLCYRSLCDSGMPVIANGPLRDTLRRVHAFGVTLVSLDIRQNAARHTAVLDEITEFLHIGPSGSYAHWTEAERLEFLLSELGNRRPLFPEDWPATPGAREVLDTCHVIAELNGAGIGHYIVSEARSPTDVLAAVLLLQECGVTANLPITPQFETLSDLDRVASAVDELLSIPWYREYVESPQPGSARGLPLETKGEQRVLIGYADSAKNAGQLASAWRQFQAKEQLTEVTRRHGVELVLFHGRGGAVGRSRETARAAILSQPPGCISGRLRVTEPGEAIRFKLGDSALARDTLMRYLIGTIEASLDPPAPPTSEQREAMNELAEKAFEGYRELVADTPGFVDYFREITPEEELTALTIGGRSDHRHAPPDIAALSAVSWVFAWTQVRLILPAWLGSDAALHALHHDPPEDAAHDAFASMMDWPFFSMQMNTLEALLAKTDIELADFYANRLTPKDHRDVHEIVRERLAVLKDDLLALTGESEFLASQPMARDSIDIRDTYLDPLHLLQAELLARLREGEDEQVAQALRATMAGIASGLLYTG